MSETSDLEVDRAEARREDDENARAQARYEREEGRMPLDPQNGTRDYDEERDGPLEPDEDEYLAAPAPWETPPRETPEEQRQRDREDVDLGIGEWSGATQREQERRDGPGPSSGPPRRRWPGHEDCAGIDQYDEVEGYVCSCGAMLGHHWPDTDEVERTVAEVQARPRADIDLRDPVRTTMGPLARDNITPAEVEGHLADILTRLETGLQYERWCADEYARLKLDLDLAMARTVKDRRGGSQDVRRAEALIENEDLVRATQEAEGRWKAVKDTMHTVRSLQHGYQSILRSVRDTYVSPAQGRGGWNG
jgi:hypothetical protein